MSIKTKNILPTGEPSWSKDEYYESRTINSGRSDKECIYCGNNIMQGTRHEVHKFCVPEYIDLATHLTNPVHGDRPQPGEKSCSELFIESLN